MAPTAGAQLCEREAGGSGEGEDRNADGPESYRGGVGEEADGGGAERGEAEGR